jgi:hypothetical protein
MTLIKSAKKDNMTDKSSSFLLKGKQQMKTEVDPGNTQLTRILNTLDPEVTETTVRRKFTTAYKYKDLNVVNESVVNRCGDGCSVKNISPSSKGHIGQSIFYFFYN